MTIKVSKVQPQFDQRFETESGSTKEQPLTSYQFADYYAVKFSGALHGCYMDTATAIGEAARLQSLLEMAGINTVVEVADDVKKRE